MTCRGRAGMLFPFSSACSRRLSWTTCFTASACQASRSSTSRFDRGGVSSRMKLWQLRRHWDALAKDDPFWAVLTQSQKQGNRWAIDEFFSTGVAEAAADVARARAVSPGLRMGRALDFGCGAGRLTQGLARHFERVTGLDISERMV